MRRRISVTLTMFSEIPLPGIMVSIYDVLTVVVSHRIWFYSLPNTVASLDTLTNVVPAIVGRR